MRSAAGVRLICNQTKAAAPICTSLVSFLPALEDVELKLCAPVGPEELGCLLEALAWSPRLRALDLSTHRAVDGYMFGADEGDADLHWPFPAPALAKLSSLSSLALSFYKEPYALADVVGALVPLTGLVDLSLTFFKYGGIHLVPAALGQLKALRSLTFTDICTCVLEAGCLELPGLQSLDFLRCKFPDAEVLPGVSALQCLTGIGFSGGTGPVTLDPQLAQLPGLQRMVFSQDADFELHLELGPPGPLRVPYDMATLSATLLHLDISGHMGTQFPLSLTQLVALEHLNAGESGFLKLPVGITALSRLTELMLGRTFAYDEDPLQLRNKRPLDVLALGDLSGFPALCKLTFRYCEVTLCHSVLGAARHASLAGMCFVVAHPAPKCAPAVLQLSRELWRLRRGSVLKALCNKVLIVSELQDARGCSPCEKFLADLEALRLEASGL